MIMKNHPILSEKPEDQMKSAKWAEEQVEKMERNRQIGDEVWLRIQPVIQAARTGKEKGCQRKSRLQV